MKSAVSLLFSNGVLLNLLLFLPDFHVSQYITIHRFGCPTFSGLSAFPSFKRYFYIILIQVLLPFFASIFTFYLIALIKKPVVLIFRRPCCVFQQT